jgi:NAD+ kinase
MKKMTEIKSVAILANPNNEQAVSECEIVADYLKGKGVSSSFGSLSDVTLRKQVEKCEVDLVITLGGDGTVLRAGHLCAPSNVPIMPINFGRFGFLIEVPSSSWREHIDMMLAGDFWLERRMMLKAMLTRDGEVIERWQALNDVVVGRGKEVRPVHLRTILDDKYLTTYVADALIVSSSTGSTAYALAAGGPILPPELRNLLLIPVAPHLSLDRAIVLAEGSTVKIEMEENTNTVISVDGQEAVDFLVGDMIEIAASSHSVQIMRFQQPEYFYNSILSLMDQNPSTGAGK